jgi:B12-binding domain/radical SAM domain protein
MTDLILLHAPSIFDFREKNIFYGPVSDVVPSTPVFEMYPVGLASLSAYLEKKGYRVRIVNLAYRMLEDPLFNPEDLIRKLEAAVFGLDLHWLPHVQGSLEVARLVREIHPGSKVVFGGHAATYYHRELVSYPQVDYVLKGDSTEEPLKKLLDAVAAGGGFEDVPNLTWRDSEDQIVENPISHVPESLDYAILDYRSLLRQVFRYRDLKNVVPFQDWLKYPITMALTCRGCMENCVICGGSQYTFERFYGRPSIAFRSPQRLVSDMVRISSLTRAPIFIVGDIRQAGEDYADEILDRLSRAGVKNELILEFFRGVDETFMNKIARSVKRFSMEISPETHDEKARMACGKRYTNRELENTIQYAVSHGARKVDVFFMVGLAGQDHASVMETADYARRLLGENNGRGVIYPFISPLAPFLDPGSLAFENPERFGYRLRFKSLEEHRQAMLAPSWKDTLNYETNWMTREEIARSTYEAALELVNARSEAGVLDSQRAEEQTRKILQSMEMLQEEDKGGSIVFGNPGIQPDKSTLSTLNDPREIQWPFSGRGIRLRGVLTQKLKWLIRDRF